MLALAFPSEMTFYTALMESRNTLVSSRAIERLFDGDHTLWSDSPTELTNRLGWLTEPKAMVAQIPQLNAFMDSVESLGIDRVLWCGMGGSSLFPDLLAESSLRATDGLLFEVLDSSHPNAVRAAHAFARDGHALIVVASKSGGTIETRSHLEYLWEHLNGKVEFAAVTDAGSALDINARSKDFLGVFNANPNIGGRFSALSHFGMLAAVLLGVDVASLLHGAIDMLERCRQPEVDNPGIELGALMGSSALAGRDKLILECHPGFAAWLEQLIAESTGKHGKGILPVPGTATDANGDDRIRVSYGNGGDLDLSAVALMENATSMGAEIVRWEVATALAGAVLQINPFDQPDVEAAKRAASEALNGSSHTIIERSCADAVAELDGLSYLTLQGFVDPRGETAQNLDADRSALRDATGRVVTGAVGPRYLHSTGQLHKGGPRTGCSLQILDTDLEPLAIPGRAFGFDDLLRAQANGDYQALQDAGHTVHRVRNWTI